MNHLNLGKIALILADGDLDAAWYEEAASRCGFLFDLPGMGAFEKLSQWQVVILCGRGRLTADQAAGLRRWVDFGGCLLVTGGSWGLEEDLGHTPSRLPRFSRAKMTLPKPTPLVCPEDEEILFFGGARAVEKEAKVYARGPEGEAAASIHGRWLWFAPHVGQSLRVMLMGRSVECDGVGPGDGSAVLEDGIKRAEDGSPLSFDLDRPREVFSQPWADILVDAWARLVLHACDLAGQTTILKSPWPNGFESAAIVSIDCDSKDEAPRRMATVLSKFGIKAGWIAPHAGLAKDLSRQLKAGDHSFGLLFLGGGKDFAEDALKLQMMQAGRQFGASALTCCRPADGGWEGWDKFYGMMAKAGARASLSKGGRQAGTSGFLFGSAGPFLAPLLEKGYSPVVEIPYQACLPATPDSWLRILADQVTRKWGCFHVVVNLIDSPEMDLDRAVISLNMTLRQKRMLPLTPDQAAHFTLGVRTMACVFTDQLIQSMSSVPLPGLTFLTPPNVSLEALAGAGQYRPVERFGRRFHAWSFDLQAKTRLSLKSSLVRAAA